LKSPAMTSLSRSIPVGRSPRLFVIASVGAIAGGAMAMAMAMSASATSMGTAIPETATAIRQGNDNGNAIPGRDGQLRAWRQSGNDIRDVAGAAARISPLLRLLHLPDLGTTGGRPDHRRGTVTVHWRGEEPHRPFRRI
jgi:hypothetical protein